MTITEQSTRDLKSIFETLDTRLSEAMGTAFYVEAGDAPSEAEVALLVDLRDRVGAVLGMAGGNADAAGGVGHVGGELVAA